MKHKNIKDFKEDLNELSEREIRELAADTRLRLGDMEAQLAERNAYDEVDEVLLVEDARWRAKCLTALKWERRRYALLKRAIAKRANVDVSIQYLRCASKLLGKFIHEEAPTKEDRKAALGVFDYLRSVAPPETLEIEASEEKPSEELTLSVSLT